MHKVLSSLLLGIGLLFATAATAEPRTLPMALDGIDTLVDVTAPEVAQAEAQPFAVILVHGFTRSRATMAGHAEALAKDGFWAVAPDLPYFLSSENNALALRDLVAALSRGAAGKPISRFVLVGFSAGGLSALLAARAPGVVGYIGLDPVDRPNGVGLAAARRLMIPTYLLRGQASACNASSIAEPWVKALPSLVLDRQLPEASHCDFESPTDTLCRRACGDTDPRRQATVLEFLRKALQQIRDNAGPA